MKLYPLLFEPNLHEVVWGGKKLTKWKQLPAHEQPVGESWEVSCVPQSVSVIANGEAKGMDLATYIAQQPAAVLGKGVAKAYDNQLPLLVKFIDAKRNLSIQVHPNDEMAARLFHKKGKSEMWYVISAEPGAYLYAGFKTAINAQEYRRLIAEGDITTVLAKHRVHPGDVFYIPAGRVHAIGEGIVLAEIQQSSDLTFRIYDYGRLGMDGKPRELHTDLAAEALDYNVYDNYRTTYSHEALKAKEVLATRYFNVRVVDTETSFHRNLLKYDSFIISLCIEGDCKIKIRATGDEITLREGYSCLIPAAIADYDIIPLEEKTKVIDAYIDSKQLEK
ncbi:type I phosphomannose isomerase catalytic subunit [Segatella oulorum]|uniref:type I phosphomannose isomerase catalytic subunit n=1 Tax=Segatella oulorum TaxID=28136 RepID=UPI0023F12DA7|nr:type I phosphomannose isomerase catalytic subunit [Segatella oulorum]